MSVENDRHIDTPKSLSLHLDTGEGYAGYGAGIGAAVGVVLAIFTSAGLVPAVLAMSLYGLLISGLVSLLESVRQARRIR